MDCEFVGTVGKLMENIRLAQLMMSSFAGVEKMLTGKKFPMNICALRFVDVELLRGQMEEACLSIMTFRSSWIMFQQKVT